VKENNPDDLYPFRNSNSEGQVRVNPIFHLEDINLIGRNLDMYYLFKFLNEKKFPNKVYVLTGPTGAGKTEFLR